MADAENSHNHLHHMFAILAAAHTLNSMRWSTSRRSEFERLSNREMWKVLVHLDESSVTLSLRPCIMNKDVPYLLVVCYFALEFFNHLFLWNAVVVDNRVVVHLQAVELPTHGLQQGTAS